jgi:hypothetical protein
VRNQSPLQRIERALLRFRIEANGQDLLTRRNVITDRQISLFWDRDVIEPGEFFFLNTPGAFSEQVPIEGVWALAKLEPQPEPQSLGLIKEKIGSRGGEKSGDLSGFGSGRCFRRVRTADAIVSGPMMRIGSSLV